jgi:hypothetical protein
VCSSDRDVTFAGLLVGTLLLGVSISGCSGVHERAERPGTDGGVAPQAKDCVPYADDCPPAMYCQYVEGRTRCVEKETSRATRTAT